MKLTIDYINIKIPIIRFTKKSTYKSKYPIANNVRVGSVVMTRNCLYIGWVGKVENGKPVKIYSKCYDSDISDTAYPCYDAFENVTWYDTGIWMIFSDWSRLSEQYNAEEFHNYWKQKLKI